MLPKVNTDLETDVPGLFLAGSIVGAPSIRVSANQGHRVAELLARRIWEEGPTPPGVKDLIIAGAGPAGISAAFTARTHRLGFLLMDRYYMGTTLLNMPDGKVFDVHFRNIGEPPEGKLWYETSAAPVLHERWRTQVDDEGVHIHEHESLASVRRDPDTGVFDVQTSHGSYRSRFVLISIGASGVPRRLNVIGESDLINKQRLEFRFRGPDQYKGRSVMIIGGGNSAAEAAISIAGGSRVTLCYRKERFHRLTPENEALLMNLVADGRIRLMTRSTVLRFEGQRAIVHGPDGTVGTVFDAFLVLIGFDVPYEMLKGFGVGLV